MNNLTEDTIAYAIAYEGCKVGDIAMATRPVLYVGPDGHLRKRTAYADTKTSHTEADIPYLASQGFITMFDKPLRMHEDVQGCVIINSEILKGFRDEHFPPVQLCSLRRASTLRDEVCASLLKKGEYLLRVAEFEKAETTAWHLVNTTDSIWSYDALLVVAAARLAQSKEMTVPALHEYWVQGVFGKAYEQFVEEAEYLLFELGHTLDKEDA